MSDLSNEQKAMIYDDCVRESDRLQRITSKIKSENTGNIPPNLQQVINENEQKIAGLVRRLEGLFS